MSAMAWTNSRSPSGSQADQLQGGAGSGKSAVTFDRVDLRRATDYAAEDADVTLRLWLLLKPRLAAMGKRTVYETLERPLVPVLARMEMAGIIVDPDVLKRLSNEFATAAAAIETQVYELAGERFNIGSPKQLGDMLYGRMGLSGGRKTATGAWSTTPMRWRISRARAWNWRGECSTGGNCPSCGRPTPTRCRATSIRRRAASTTSYSMAANSTGRLASTEPNLQNIPVRTEEGRKIRAAFVAPEGSKLISADTARSNCACWPMWPTSLS